MRTERDIAQVEPSEGVSSRSDSSAIAPSVNGNGTHAHTNGANGAVHSGARNGANGTHAGTHNRLTNGAVSGRLVRPVSVTPDWDSFLPDRAAGLRWKIAQRLKRGLDLALAGLGMVALAPLFAVVAVLIKASSRGPIFYVCEYVGFRGRRFPGYKFRTMHADAEARKADLAHLNHMTGPAFKIRDDPRITGVGRVLRKYSIDELPQLWNVFRGDMSLVGPRPPLPEEWAEYKEWQRGKLAVIPGITCYWQVNGRSEITDFDEWAQLDLKYIEEWSLLTDAKILARTIPAVLTGDGAY